MNYTSTTLGKHTLHVPSKELKQHQQEVLSKLKDDVSYVGVHALNKQIREDLPSYTHFTRTDISACFATLDRAYGMQQVHTWLAKVGKQDYAPDFENLFLPNTDKGIAIGSPLSPLMQKIVADSLNIEDSLLPAKVYRYVDDILVLHRGEFNIDNLQKILEPTGWKLSKTKTIHGEIATTPFEFLGYHFPENKLNATQYSCKSLGAQNHTEIYELHEGTTGYDKRSGVTSNSFCQALLSLETGSPTAFMAIALKCMCEGTPLQAVDSEDLKKLHSKVYSGYVTSVKKPRDSGKVVNASESEKILILTGLLTFIRENGHMPASTQEFRAHMPNFDNALLASSTADGAYHSLIKNLFSREYAARTNTFSQNLPPTITGMDL